jgi:hypothetical protein
MNAHKITLGEMKCDRSFEILQLFTEGILEMGSATARVRGVARVGVSEGTQPPVAASRCAPCRHVQIRFSSGLSLFD